ncbi:MAG: helix-turn-helix transcriptional regulator [Desulfovibrio sp.]
MSLKALKIALEAGQDLMRRLDVLKAALEAGQDDVALELAREITGAQRRPQKKEKGVGQGVEGEKKATADQVSISDEDRLLRAIDARKFLGNMTEATFYRNIKRGIIPKQRYVGGTPVWRLGDLREVIKQLPCNPVADER